MTTRLPCSRGAAVVGATQRRVPAAFAARRRPGRRCSAFPPTSRREGGRCSSGGVGGAESGDRGDVWSPPLLLAPPLALGLNSRAPGCAFLAPGRRPRPSAASAVPGVARYRPRRRGAHGAGLFLAFARSRGAGGSGRLLPLFRGPSLAGLSRPAGCRGSSSRRRPIRQAGRPRSRSSRGRRARARRELHR